MIKNIKKIIKIFIICIFGKTGVPIKIGTNYRLMFHPRYFRWFTQTYETDHLDYLKKMTASDGVAIDIGAHFGLYSLVLAKYFKKHVIAFEPTPYSAEIFRKNIAFNKLSNLIELREAAVGREIGTATFLIQQQEGAVSNSLVDYWHSDEHKNKIKVDVVSIDETVSEKINFIKIDAEGNELDVLLGAKSAIEKNRPWILLALHPSAIEQKGDKLEEIWNYFEKKQYQIIFNSQPMTKDIFVNRSDLFDVILDPTINQTS